MFALELNIKYWRSVILIVTTLMTFSPSSLLSHYLFTLNPWYVNKINQGFKLLRFYVVVFPNSRLPRDFVYNISTHFSHYKERHDAEIAAFHLDRYADSYKINIRFFEISLLIIILHLLLNRFIGISRNLFQFIFDYCSKFTIAWFLDHIEAALFDSWRIVFFFLNLIATDPNNTFTADISSTLVKCQSL